jgi:hypothetical protein
VPDASVTPLGERRNARHELQPGVRACAGQEESAQRRLGHAAEDLSASDGDHDPLLEVQDPFVEKDVEAFRRTVTGDRDRVLLPIEVSSQDRVGDRVLPPQPVELALPGQDRLPDEAVWVGLAAFCRAPTANWFGPGGTRGSSTLW